MPEKAVKWVSVAVAVEGMMMPVTRSFPLQLITTMAQFMMVTHHVNPTAALMPKVLVAKESLVMGYANCTADSGSVPATASKKDAHLWDWFVARSAQAVQRKPPVKVEFRESQSWCLQSVPAAGSEVVSNSNVCKNEFDAPRAARDFRGLRFSKIVLASWFSIRRHADEFREIVANSAMVPPANHVSR